ncbi:MAG: aldo/keto reductase [Succinivibrio sp.]|uniref:aldo/keto reductase n=1 Tax=Succinivibrio dextrinosolvens TaxID=83771 RepID=UPI0004E145B7|nr:aldo/keto reductase [Succinivibrio dextrinosolvens]MBQ3678557.1 aldo/keto reductase [Succinivibrio sp.]
MKEYVTLKNGLKMPRLGMGMWYIGEESTKARSEYEAIRMGIDAGLKLIDTAEMYGMGRSESFVGRAIKNYDRSSLFLVSKVLPSNAGRNHIRSSLEHSLRRLETDYLDLYLYHWIGETPFPEVVESMERFVEEGIIRSWGVSNFDTEDMIELVEHSGGENCVVNQVLYHLGSRGIEYDLLPYLKDKNIYPMSYCPLAQGGSLSRGILQDETVQKIARNHNLSPSQVLLAFVLANEDMIAIPRSSSAKHMLENAAVRNTALSQEELALLNKAFPAPDHKVPLDVC